MGENWYHVKFSFNSTNNLNYKETFPEFIASERKKILNTSEIREYLPGIVRDTLSSSSGRIQRMSINSLPYRAYYELANGFKAKGRPRKRWRDDI
jgi:hypothetical protein